MANSDLDARIDAYVARFNAEEVAAGYLPSPTLGKLFAVLDMRAVLNARARVRRARRGNPFAFEKRREGQAASGGAGPVAPRRRKRADQVAALLRRGHLGRRQHDAAREVREAYAAIVRTLFRRQTVDVKVDVSRRERLPIELWSTREQRLIRGRYGPWKQAMRAPLEVRLGDGRRLVVTNALEIVMDLVWDNLGPRQVDDRHGLRRGSAVRIVAAGLQRYVRLAGWEGNG